MNTPLPVSVRVTRRFSASAERVFDAWLDPEKVRTWMAAAAVVQPARGKAVRIEIDARVGGTFTFVDLRNGEEVEHTGKYLELVRPRRLVFTWCLPKFSPDSDVVSIDIVPLETGCELTLTHEMKPEYAEYAGRTEKGWTIMVDAIATTLS